LHAHCGFNWAGTGLTAKLRVIATCDEYGRLIQYTPPEPGGSESALGTQPIESTGLDSLQVDFVPWRLQYKFEPRHSIVPLTLDLKK
jgi:hypothetical protein